MDSERPIEKLLRNSAGKRAEDAGEPLSLHPATRRLLQGEVARVYGRTQETKAPDASASLLNRLWPTVGWALTVLTGLLVAASLMLPKRPSQNFEMAMAGPEKSSADRSANSRAAAPEKSLAQNELAAPARMKETLADSSRAASRGQPESQPMLAYDASAQNAKLESLGMEKRKDVLLRDEAKVASPTVAVAPPARALSGSANKAAFANADLAGPAAAPTEQPAPSLAAAPSSPPLPPQGTTSRLDEKAHAVLPDSSTGERNRASRRFVQAASGTGALLDKTAPPILAAFDFEQNGSEIRIVDADGSVYLGALKPLTAPSSAVAQTATPARALAEPNLKLNRVTAQAAPAQPADHDDRSAIGYSFQAEGTNQTLKQKVVLTGAFVNLQASEARFKLERTTNAIAETATRKATDLAQPAAMPGPRISGKAVVGGAAYDINAVPAP